MQKILHSKILSKFTEIHHGTSTKKFGPLSFTYDKDSNEVIIDRAKFLTELNLPLNHSVFLCEQNHTDNIVYVSQKDAGRGTFDQKNRIPNADAMITKDKNLNLIVYTADCMPILIFDPKEKIIAAVHSGWKGTIKKITIKTLEKMEKNFGCNKKNFQIYIGPSIGPCCYSVKNKEQIELFQKNYDNVISRDKKFFIDLWDSVEKDLLDFGISKKNYENSKICTVCNKKFFASHRGDNPRTTTNLSVISII